MLAENKNSKSFLWKQTLVGFLLLILPIVLFYFSGVGARLSCDPRECTIIRKQFTESSEDRLIPTEIERIGYNYQGAGRQKTGVSSSGFSGSDLEIHLKNGKNILIFGTPVGYQFGNLDFRSLDSLRETGKLSSASLASYSFGGKLLFIGPTLAAIGYVLILISFVRPVSPDLDPKLLGKNRILNLILFVTTLSIVTFTYLMLWNWAKSYLIS
ncbi:hypothetical protein [Leptospira kanakyensis]|uniref:Uncharacterized protein n=1 Tax=Leptospira kanakyensis TaxID=2484968 RepID=A0A6N4PUX3_9LEPT|nr:hypothetical protein [Leptospira kanakyensis]MCW7482389.1 hypothetical protein [Leptospira kanakyensis]TGK49289.1 hypothetical protein EHQ11_14730 [Leptospira kanakyensis]TGK60470.1 hypothetical protein EHQ16_10460 [Leptospira kanakyensis]TGK67869.1 hypothetical protein EHQ18_15260 [Leptospira kanakyensis]